MTPRAVVLSGLLAVGLGAAAVAEIVPRPGTGDPRIQTVVYDPLQVVALHVAPGFAVTVDLSPEERIETVTLGDTGSWQVQVNKRADRLVIKPVGYPQTTNLTAITDQRSYNFTLYGASAGDETLPYTVAFTYPTPAMEQPVSEVAVTGRYRVRGARSLHPAAISDDGESTSIVWPEAATLPAVYTQDEQRHLSLVNGLMRNGIYVVQGVHKRLIFKLGKSQASATRFEPKEPK